MRGLGIPVALALLAACAREPQARSDSAGPDTASRMARASAAVSAIAAIAPRDATQRWNRAMMGPDSSAMHDLFADDGVWLLRDRPGGPMLNRDSLRAFIATGSKAPPDQERRRYG